jgi:predicted N-acetyltransferase YhbS
LPTSSSLSPELREYAETPDRFARVIDGSSVSRFDDGRVCVIQGATWASISAPNVEPEDVEALLTEVRSLISPEKAATWWIGPSARPSDIVERLEALGLEPPRDGVSRVVSLVRTDEPAAIPPGIEMRRVETYEDFVAARHVQWDAFDTPEERRAVLRPLLQHDFYESMQLGIPVGFIASLDGRPAAGAMSIPSERGVFLIAGAVAPWARGRGVYRALVRARWDDAVARGTPALVTQAHPQTSYPILRRLGFEEVCEIRRLEDVRSGKMPR